MNGPLAQLVCLATYGGRWLAAPLAGPPPDPMPRNSTFRYVGRVSFRGDSHWDDVPSWLSGLRDRGATALRLHVETAPPARTSPPDSVRFGSRGTEGLLARTDSGPELWRAHWTHTGTTATERGQWSVEYVAAAADVTPPVPPLDAAEAALRAALAESETLAREVGEPFWAERFAGAADGTFRYHPDMVPPDLDADRRRVAALAEQAWPFGGMGSWNEAIGDEHPAALRLHAAILDALAAVANG